MARTYTVELTAQQMSYLESAMEDTRTVNRFVGDVRKPEFDKIRAQFAAARREAAIEQGQAAAAAVGYAGF